ncbi:LLM class flavin-dependent oxidoreductase [Gordonia rubripertincta]|uniref:LLM class flavin-dependent oxidoreductase n=1 Tax=Gordonia rubripertincta TaxID=36822 RepID=A0ABT4MWM7_GORRU|nr:LLM class flavin-dependent oxidoreductase [Gordonia rubripertincta]MCZ4551412.1 LLM class flavin-dependent oxidoreductase [Gordonia rubripertincta]
MNSHNSIEVGLGLWTMRSTAYAPAPWQSLYRQMVDDASLAERRGFNTFWLAEHHFWYDGWCPQPLVAASAILSATTTLRVGTAMHLLPMHDPTEVSRELAAMRRLHGARIDFGVGLGYRDEEYDGVGIARRSRGQRMSNHLDALLTGEATDDVPIFVGGIADAAIRRAGSRGLSLLLPNTLSAREVRRRIDMAAEEADARGLPPGRTGMLIDTWIVGKHESQTVVTDRLARHYREYAGAWYSVSGSPMFSRPDLLDRQSARTRDAAVIGSSKHVLERLMELRDVGVDTFVLQVRSDTAAVDYRRVIDELADDVLDDLRAAA